MKFQLLRLLRQRPVLKVSYSAELMDRGRGMVFHPVDGKSLTEAPFNSDFQYDSDQSQYFAQSNPHWDGTEGSRYYYHRIGDGSDYSAGDFYPNHWIFDPYTGKTL